jgi:hypothetical protein
MNAGVTPRMTFMPEHVDVQGTLDALLGDRFEYRYRRYPALLITGQAAETLNGGLDGLLDAGRIGYIQAAHQHIVTSCQVPPAAETFRIVAAAFQPLSANSLAVTWPFPSTNL